MGRPLQLLAQPRVHAQVSDNPWLLIRGAQAIQDAGNLLLEVLVGGLDCRLDGYRDGELRETLVRQCSH
eukprot:1947870-Pyramimonas_sp.AAC.1